MSLYYTLGQQAALEKLSSAGAHGVLRRLAGKTTGRAAGAEGAAAGRETMFTLKNSPLGSRMRPATEDTLLLHTKQPNLTAHVGNTQGAAIKPGTRTEEAMRGTIQSPSVIRQNRIKEITGPLGESQYKYMSPHSFPASARRTGSGGAKWPHLQRDLRPEEILKIQREEAASQAAVAARRARRGW